MNIDFNGWTSLFPFLIGKVLTSCIFECDGNGNVVFPFLIGKVLTILYMATTAVNQNDKYLLCFHSL